MAAIFRLHKDPHVEVQVLLPWYVNDTLCDDEAAMVETHLATCAACRVELEQERRLAMRVADLPLDSEHGWAAMMERLAKQPAAGRPPVPKGFFARQVPVGWAIGAPLVAAAAAVVLSLTFVRTPELAGQDYRALGSPAASSEGNTVVLFKPDTTTQQLQTILSANRAQIVDGPNPAGALVLRIPSPDHDRALADLRNDSQVIVAEPIGSDD